MLFTCPICDSHTYHFNSVSGYATQCKSCGYSTFVIQRRSHVDLDNDLGRIKFLCYDNPWGFATMTSTKGQITEFAVTNDLCIDFMNWLKSNSDNYTNVSLSYFKDDEIRITNLLDLL